MTKSKYEKALEALKFIADSRAFDPTKFALETVAELTAPRMETVEVSRWVMTFKDGEFFGIYDQPKAEFSSDLIQTEITIPITRPIEEKEEVWEGNIHHVIHLPGGVRYAMIDRLPPEWLDKTVEVRLKGE